MRARAICKLRNGDTDFVIETKVGNVKDGLDRLKGMILNEFDHSFVADDWSNLTITIERDRL